MRKLLIAGKFSPNFLGKLEKEPLSVHYRPGISREALHEEIKETELLLIRSKAHVDKTLLDKAPRLRWVGRAGVGLDKIDVEELNRRNIILEHTPGANRHAVGEHAVGLLLSLLHRINKSWDEVRGGKWLRNENIGVELRTLTVGIIGFGNTGSAFAEKLSGFGCSILAYDKYKAGFGGDGIQETGLGTLLAKSDVISFHVPLTKETRGWVNKAFLSELSHPVILLNLSRGGIFDATALLEGLKNESVAAVGLDVWENEYINTFSSEEHQRYRELCALKQVILTPHIAGRSHTALENIERSLFMALQKYLKA